MCHNLNITTYVPQGTILTPRACANIINELIKCVLYQKSQIPYPFFYLEKAIAKKRGSEDNTNSEKRMNFTIENHFRTASKVYDAIVDIFSNIEKELSNENAAKEFVFLFGATYNLPKEYFSIIIPRLEQHHNEKVHFEDTQKCVRNILRTILTSDEWKQYADKSIPITNMYILLKKSQTTNNNFFVPIDNFIVNSKINQLAVKVHNSSTKSTCCSQVHVFGQDVVDINDFNNEIINNWYIANICLKGYKEVFINKVSASEVW